MKIHDRFLFEYQPARIRLYGNFLLVFAIFFCMLPDHSNISMIVPCFLLFLGCYELKLAYEIQDKQKTALAKKYERLQKALQNGSRPSPGLRLIRSHESIGVDKGPSSLGKEEG